MQYGGGTPLCSFSHVSLREEMTFHSYPTKHQCRVVSASTEYFGSQVPDVMTEVLHGFSQSFPANADAMP
jgi:hypothetical protein